jgi:hypothetical protein
MSITKRLLAEREEQKHGQQTEHTPSELNQLIVDWEDLAASLKDR